MKKIFTMMLLIGLALSSLAAQKALVIGNTAYGGRALPQPTKDLALTDSTLAKNGWSVTKLQNPDAAELKNAIINFANKLTEDEMALVYYTGSAIQIKGKNYLVPVGSFKDETAFLKDAIELGWMIGQMHKAQLRLVFLDAARSPANLNFKLAQAGLAAMDKMPAKTLLMYNAPINTVQTDTATTNSYFATAFSQQIIQPDQDISKLSTNLAGKMAILHGGKTPPKPYGASSIEEGWILNPSDDNTIRFRFRGIIKAIPDGGGSYSF